MIIKKLYILKNLEYKVLMRKMGLEPTRHECHKILSLARLPVPTLPHSILAVIFTIHCLVLTTSDIILFQPKKVNHYFSKKRSSNISQKF